VLLLYLIIFISGGAILALELLASRIMTPYFGVSLYIWTGILSITLVSLALGYWAGGRYAGGRNGRPLTVARLVQGFALMPAIAAIAIVAACLAYPQLFSPLANSSLVFGAFAACLILLFLPLVATSAMNPLLVAIFLQGAGRHSGDAGAGKVFFVSTIGSVAGVLVTAFGLIPFITNFAAALVVALTLALLSLALAIAPPAPIASRGIIAAAAVFAALASALLLWQADAYTGRMRPVSYGDSVWRIEASHGSLFGTVKIIKSTPDPDTGRFRRIYFQDGLIQNTVDSNGRSLSFYTYALEALAYAYRPDMRTALVLGMGAGIVPMQLAARGVNVDVVEIDPVSPLVARQYFGFDPARARVHRADARAFVHNCPRRFDIVVVDLFQGDGTPDYLVTREFFRDLKQCLAERGVAVFNTFADIDRPVSYAHFLATLKTELPHVVLYRPDSEGAALVNSFVAASAGELSAPVRVTLDYVPERFGETLWAMLAHPIALDRKLLAGGVVITDARNTAALDAAATQLIYRRAAVAALPQEFLLN
jgi:predicted membrane-bound spermidine synthase